MLEKSLTHREEGLAQLAEQFHDKQGIESFLSPFLDQVQGLESAYFSIVMLTHLSVAEGVQLDGLGDIVGEKREGRDDDSYRTAILARIVLNLSSGTVEDLIEITRAILGPVVVEIIEYAYANFELIVQDVLTPDDPLWQPSTVYSVGDRVSNFENNYIAVVGGTSDVSEGPFGTGSSIGDGTVTWAFYSLGLGLRTSILVLSGKPAGVRGIFRWHEVEPPFAFFDSLDGAGFDTGYFAQAVSS